MPLNTSGWPKPDLPALGDGVDSSGTARMILDRMFGQHPEYMIAEPGGALLISSVRLMDKTVSEYMAAREAAQTFATGRDGVRAGRPSDYFQVLDRIETSIGALHRTILHIDAIRAQRNAPNIDRVQRGALAAATTQVNDFRDKIEHADEEIRRSPSGATYPVLLVEDSVFRIGDASISYVNFAQWIGQVFRLLQTVLPSQSTTQ